MTRRQWIGFVVFPAAVASLLAFLFFVANVGVFGRRSAAEALAELAGASSDQVRMSAAGRVQQLASEGDLDRAEAVRALRAALADRSADVRMKAAEGLARLAPEEAAEPIAALLADPHATVRMTAAFLLGFARARGQAEALAKALGDEVEPVRWNAAVALAQLGDGRGREVLHGMLMPAPPRSAARALSYMLPTGEEIRVEPDRKVHANAILALDLVGDRTSLGPLERFVEAQVEPDLDALARAAAKDIEARTRE